MNGWVGLAIGLALLAVPIVQISLAVRNRVRLRAWKKVEGRATATSVSESLTRQGMVDKTYRTTYSFLAEDGRTYFGHGSMGDVSSGSPVEIVYDPAEPKRNQPVLKAGVAARIVPAVLGLLFLLVGVFAVVNAILLLTTGTGIE